ncbi:MAG: baseplate J/gp47 family protein [Candidatus Methanofastidiosum sp.]|nr:baseplate J/gp47 family protein [Methanofastidiosum sp.]
MFDMLDSNPSAVFRGLLSKHFPELPSGPDSPTYSYLIAPIEVLFKSYHDSVKKELEDFRNLLRGDVSKEYIMKLPTATLDFYGMLHGISRLPSQPSWGVLKVTLAGTTTPGTRIAYPEIRFTAGTGTYRTVPTNGIVPESRTVYLTYKAVSARAERLAYGTSVALGNTMVQAAEVYLTSDGTGVEDNWSYFSRIRNYITGRVSPGRNILITAAQTLSGANDYQLVGKDNRMFRDIVAFGNSEDPTYSHLGGMVDLYVRTSNVVYGETTENIHGLTETEKSLTLIPRTMYLDYGVVLVNGTVRAVDYPGPGTFLEDYMDSEDKRYDLTLGLPVIDLRSVFPGAILNILALSVGGVPLEENTDYVIISGDRGGTFTAGNKLLVVFNPATFTEGTSVNIEALYVNNWTDAEESFKAMTEDLVGIDALLKPYMPISVEISLVLGSSEIEIDKNQLVNQINGEASFDLGRVLSNITERGGQLQSYSTRLTLRTPTFKSYVLENTTAATPHSFAALGVPFTDLYRFYTAPDLISINYIEG